MNAAESKNKLVRSISETELLAFLESLLNEKNVTGAFIQDQAKERFGVEIGHNSANEFRRDIFGSFVEKMRRAAQMARTVGKEREAAEGHTLADAASDLLQQQMFEFMVEANLDLSNPKDVERAEAYARIIKSGRSEDRRMIDQLRDRVKELETKQREAEKLLEAAAPKEGGLSDATINAVRKALGMPEA